MTFEEYLDFLRQLQTELEELNAVEQKKIEAVRDGDLESLGECMKQEQAATLALRGREQRRAAMLAELGLQQVPLRELAKHAPDDCREETTRTVEHLLRTYQVLSSARNTARTLMESQLHIIEKQLHQQNDNKEETHAAGQSQTDFRV